MEATCKKVFGFMPVIVSAVLGLIFLAVEIPCVYLLNIAERKLGLKEKSFPMFARVFLLHAADCYDRSEMPEWRDTYKGVIIGRKF